MNIVCVQSKSLEYNVLLVHRPNNGPQCPDCRGIVKDGCDADCSKSHSSLKCLCCDQPWERHSGHNCPSAQGGGRGSFLVPSLKMQSQSQKHKGHRCIFPEGCGGDEPHRTSYDGTNPRWSCCDQVCSLNNPFCSATQVCHNA